MNDSKPWSRGSPRRHDRNRAEADNFESFLQRVAADACSAKKDEQVSAEGAADREFSGRTRKRTESRNESVTVAERRPMVF